MAEYGFAVDKREEQFFPLVAAGFTEFLRKLGNDKAVVRVVDQGESFGFALSDDGTFPIAESAGIEFLPVIEFEEAQVVKDD